MDIQKTAKEIGLFETAINLAKVCHSDDVVQKVGAVMPLPDENIDFRVEQIAKWLLGFRKRNYMFLTPEIALIEEMGRLSKHEIEFIIVIPRDMEPDARERLLNNLPNIVKVEVLDEPYFPQSFFPGNGLMVISGYLGGERVMVFHDAYRMVEHYKDFWGKKVFVPYKELDISKRYDGWMEISTERLSEIWRNKA